MGQLWWEAARKQFYLCRIFYPGVSWTYFILVQDKDNFFVIGMVARFDREILVFLPCEFCIFHFANVYHTAEQSVVGSAATNINTQPTSFVIQGKSTACTADNAVGASVTQNWENCENCPNAAEAAFLVKIVRLNFCPNWGQVIAATAQRSA